MTDDLDVPVSVLDIAPVVSGSSPRQAIRNTLDLAQRTEALGYRRYWLAEHHNLPSVASCAPAVLVGQVANVTSTMRVGSGGVMLANHVPLMVAEQFGTLEALHPGRIDLGIGSAPGTDNRTATLLRRSTGPLSNDGFPELLADLISYFAPPDGSTPEPIVAVPAPGNQPLIWLLGSSSGSAATAARLGLPYAFAHLLRSENTLPALEVYRDKLPALGTPGSPVRDRRHPRRRR